MYCVGLTGNIASGKSTVASLFKRHGIDVINADDVSRSVTKPGESALEKIVEHFGDAILDNGHLNRRKLRTIIFNDANERHWLESLLHPIIREKIKEAVSSSKSPYCLVEIPLLPDRKDYPYIDRILYIEAPREVQIERLMKRDHSTRDEALAILNTQSHEDDHRRIADDVLINNGPLSDLKKEVNKRHAKFISQCR